MSYILDALRKADEERERGTVPSVHAQPSFGGGTVAEAAPRSRPWGWIGGGLVVAALLVGATWYVAGGRREADLPARSVAAAAPPVAIMTPAPTPAPATAPATPSVAAAPSAKAIATTGTPPGPGAPVPVTTTSPTLPLEPIRRTTPPPRPAADKRPATASDDAGAAAANPTGTAAGSPAQAGESRIYRIDQLPPDVRRQLPTLGIAGARYSPKPAERILIVNGQVLHEGDKITPDLMLQQIRPKGAVLQFQNYRYEIGF